ncbi:hypothetical protein [Absidia glauca]|uniref:Uncharacterized protein n=1 Tax=Absidia glauca TaxID=4829 RepID=A0A163JL81_ABSGL|nr:hypothetical protein [Absidia glauca]
MSDYQFISETELWSTYFNPVLSCIICDPDRLIHQRWSSTIPTEKGKSRPEAIISEKPQLESEGSNGHGEAKRHQGNGSKRSLCMDTLRLSIFNKNTIDVNKLDAALAFQIHGKARIRDVNERVHQHLQTPQPSLDTSPVQVSLPSNQYWARLLPYKTQKLPTAPLKGYQSISETELWSTYFDPVLSCLICDPDRLIHLRWTNTIPTEKGKSRPDAVISQKPQLEFEGSVGHGEAKRQQGNGNKESLCMDTLRLSIFNKNTIDVNKLDAALAFQIHGKARINDVYERVKKTNSMIDILQQAIQLAQDEQTLQQTVDIELGFSTCRGLNKRHVCFTGPPTPTNTTTIYFTCSSFVTIELILGKIVTLQLFAAIVQKFSLLVKSIKIAL